MNKTSFKEWLSKAWDITDNVANFFVNAMAVFALLIFCAGLLEVITQK